MKVTIDNILNEAKTEEQKKMALARIQKEIRKHQLTALIYGLIYLVDTSFLLIACFTLIFDEEDKAAWEELPGFIGRILHICNNWILSVPEWAVFDIINGIPTWIICLIGFAIAMIAVPAIIILIVKTIIAVFTSGNRCSPLKGTLLECYKKTGKMFKRIPLVGDVDYDFTLYFGLTYASIAIPCIISVLLTIVGLIFGIYKGWGSKDTLNAIIELVGFIITVAIALVLLYIAFMLIVSGIAIISGNIAAWGMMAVEKYKFEKFWAEVDPAKKAELKRREARRSSLWSPFTSSSSSTSYSSSSSSGSGSCTEQTAYCDPDEYIARNGFSYICGVVSDKDIDTINNDIFLSDKEKEAIIRRLKSKADLYW